MAEKPKVKKTEMPPLPEGAQPFRCGFRVDDETCFTVFESKPVEVKVVMALTENDNYNEWIARTLDKEDMRIISHFTACTGIGDIPTMTGTLVFNDELEKWEIDFSRLRAMTGVPNTRLKPKLLRLAALGAVVLVQCPKDRNPIIRNSNILNRIVELSRGRAV